MRLAMPTLPPAALSAVYLLALGVFVLIANHRRPINRIWALVLLFSALWQQSIAMAFFHPGTFFLRFAVFFAACSICSVGLLKETIVSPWRSLPNLLRRIRGQLALLLLFLLSFSRWWPSSLPNAGTASPRGPIFLILDAIGILWTSALLLHSIYLIKSNKVLGIARSELVALVALLISGYITCLGTLVFGGMLNVTNASWRASSIFVAGLSVVTVLLVRSEIFDLRDFRKGFVLLSSRGIVYLLFFFLCFSFLFGVGEITTTFRLILGLALASAFVTLPIFDCKLRQLLDRQFTSQDFIEAQGAISTLIEGSKQPSDLHAGFVEVLGRWSDGSLRVFLSDSVFMTSWPAEPIPPDL